MPAISTDGDMAYLDLALPQPAAAMRERKRAERMDGPPAMSDQAAPETDAGYRSMPI
jgi:hypothetical protein